MTAASKIVTFHDRVGTAPAWMASVLAIKETDDAPLLNQAVVLIAAHSEHEAEDKALNIALRVWTIMDGWSQHHAVVSHLERALTAWRNA